MKEQTAESHVSPHVRVGMKYWQTDQPADSPEEANCQLGPSWVEIDGVRYDGIIGFKYSAGGEGVSPGFARVTMTMLVASFESVPA